MFDANFAEKISLLYAGKGSIKNQKSIKRIDILSLLCSAIPEYIGGETARVLFRREIVSSADTLAGNHLKPCAIRIATPVLCRPTEFLSAGIQIRSPGTPPGGATNLLSSGLPRQASPTRLASTGLHGLRFCWDMGACQKNRMLSTSPAPAELHGLRPCEPDILHTSSANGPARHAFLREHGNLPEGPDATRKSSAYGPARPAPLPEHGSLPKNRMGSARSAPMDLHGLRPCVGMWLPEGPDATHKSSVNGPARHAFLRGHESLPEEPDGLRTSSATALHGMRPCVSTGQCQKHWMPTTRLAPAELHGLRPA